MVLRTFRSKAWLAPNWRVILLSLVTSGGALGVAQQLPPADSEDPWFGTFSIIAFDPATNELGVGVQSRAFGAGAAVPYAKPGVGAVATQASANRQYGPKAIALLEQGLSPEEVVKRITDEDAGRDTRQVAVIDAKGRSAVYTGKRVIDRNSDPEGPRAPRRLCRTCLRHELLGAGQHARERRGRQGHGRGVSATARARWPSG